MAASKPRWELNDALRRARVGAHLVTLHSAEVVPRLDAGLMDQVATDRVFLGDASDAKPLTDQKTATTNERELAADGHDLVMAIREAVARSPKATETLKTAMGIGDGLRPTDTRGVLDTLGAVGRNADALRAIGVQNQEIEEAASLATQLRGANAAQDVSIDARSDATHDRVTAQLRLEAAVDVISSQGALAFRKNAAVRERFERLVSSTGPLAEDDPTPPLDPPVPA